MDELAAYGWTEGVAARFEPYLRAPSVTPARVVRVDRGECDVATPVGLLRANLDHVTACTGDWVTVAELGGTPTVREVLPRTSAIMRSSVSGRSEAQVLAANVDTVLVCTAADGDVDLGRIERMLALAWESGAQPVVVLTKIDAVEDISTMLDNIRPIAPGATALAVSAATGEGLDVLAAVLDGTVALIGPSGAGKSTLGNALLGREALATNAVRETDNKGRHTTVTRELLPLRSGGTLIDTPGLRGIGLWEASEGIDKTFSDVAALAEQCRFADCGHTGEPDCAVRAAIESGELPERRLHSYRKLLKENAWTAARTDSRLRAERAKGYRELSKMQRAMYRERGRR